MSGIYDVNGNQIIVDGGGSGGGTGWSAAQINLLDTLLSHVKYADADGGEYADALIASLLGQSVTRE